MPRDRRTPRLAREASVVLLLLDAFALFQAVRLGADDQAPTWARVVFGAVAFVALVLGTRVAALLVRRRRAGASLTRFL